LSKTQLSYYPFCKRGHPGTCSGMLLSPVQSPVGGLCCSQGLEEDGRWSSWRGRGACLWNG